MSSDAERAPSAVAFVHANNPEDRARGEIYALLAHLYARAPDAALLRLIAAAPPIDEVDNALARAWNHLREASSVMDAEAAEHEYTTLFVGVGHSLVDLHASHWVGAAKSERPLVEVRADLARLGLARRAEGGLYEDHLSTLFETMRVLVLGLDDRAPASLDQQRAFFNTHISPWIDACCGATLHNDVANYYRCVAQLALELAAIERDAFVIE